MTQLLAETRKNTAYLRQFVKVVELWECEWKETRRDPVVKKCLDAAFPRRHHVRWTMTSQQILRGVRDGTIFGLIECDVSVPITLHTHFSEMQPVFKNIRLTRDDLGPFMGRYAEEHDIMTTPRRMLVGSFHGDKILLATPLLRTRTRGDARLPGRRVHPHPVLPAVRRRCVHGPTRGRRPPAQGHHRRHHEVAGKLGLREDDHQRGSTSRREILHGEGGIAHGQR